MTMRVRGENAVSGNAEVYSEKHGQRRLLLWGAAAGAGRCQFLAALVCGGCRPGAIRRARLLFLSRSGSRKKEKTNAANSTRTAAATYQCSKKLTPPSARGG